MKSTALFLAPVLALGIVPVGMATAQTTTQTAAPKTATTAKAATAKVATGGAAKPAAHRSLGAGTAIKLPPGIPPGKGLLKTAFTLRYQDLVIGTGKEAEPRKLYTVKYTGWLAADGKKFDSSYDHPNGEPIKFPEGIGRVIPGWDQGFEGMKVGGKRRLFIPYQLAYGAIGRPPAIPAKADLIFDVELVDFTDMPQPPARMAPPQSKPVTPSSAPAAPSSTAPAAAPAPATPAAPATPSSPTQPNK